jgi:2-oxoglutarate ferredoxin oxidoreductase subunit alpha
MNEMVGLAYFTEIPSSYFIVQRGGPSTGLPTRTQQSDILSMYFASHGDTRHVVLLPYDLQTSFEFGKICLDLADQLQTPVFFASDLDLGMNIRPSDPLYLKDPVLNRGKLVHEKDIEAQGNQFRRYFDLDGDGIPQRTIPGNQHPKAVYFCSGAGHNADAKRSEDPGDYKELLDRLRKKNDTARLLVPQPVVALENQSRLGIISFGSSVEAVREARHRMALDGVLSSHLTLTALPLSPIVRDFVLRHEITLIVEQNRDGQVASILRMDWPDIATKVDSVLVYDGLPITAGSVHRLAMEKLGGKLL